MNNKTPKNWITCKISDLCDFQNGYAFNSNDYVENGMPIIRMSNISVDGNLNLTPENTKYYQTEKAETLKKYILNKNDVVMAMTDMTKDMGIIGKTAIIDEDNRYLLNQRVGRLTIKNSKVLDYKYLHRYTNSPLFLNYAKQQCSGGVQLNLSTKAILEHKMILPPTIQEQQEIAQVLDTMSDIIRLREECISHAQDLIPALFQEMFGDIHNNKTNSQIVKLGDVADFIRGPFGGSLKKEIFVNEGYLVYEQYHAINNDFNFARYFIDEQKYKEMQRFSVKAGDLLISCSGTMGKIAIVPDNYKKGIINQALLKLTVNPEYLNNIFLKNLLLTDYYQKNYFKDQPGAAIQNVRSVKVLKNIDIILPSLSLQKQFVQKAIEIESYIEEQQEELENAKQMFQSLLHHAFTGELTKHKYGEINE